MPKLIVWGGFWDDRDAALQLEDLNSHASVTCYFLTEALSAHFEVVQIPGFYAIEQALQHPDAVAVLSCFQAGFSRLREKDPVRFRALRARFPGKLASVVDFVSLRRYSEDRLFTVLPPTGGLMERLRHGFCGASVSTMGWHAAPAHCRPAKRMPGQPIKVFLDHGNYAGSDYTDVIFEGLSRACGETNTEVLVLAQTNEGIVAVPKEGAWTADPYQREAKVRWIDLQKAYSEIDLFCVTHPESAGLGVIEAAMSGARILVPQKDGKPFISRRLLETGVDFACADCTPRDLARAIEPALRNGVDREENHNRLSASHGWSVGAAAIAASLETRPA